MFMESSVMFMERLCKQSETVNGCNAEQLWTFKLERSNALEWIVETAFHYLYRKIFADTVWFAIKFVIDVKTFLV